MVRAECPDIITSLNIIAHPTAYGKGMMEGLIEHLISTGNEYINTAVITPYTTAAREENPRIVTKRILQEMVTYLQERNIIPEFQFHNFTTVKNVEDWVVLPRILRKPFITNIVVGYHGVRFSTPGDTFIFTP